MNPETPDRRAHAEEVEALAAFMEERTSDTIKAAEAMAPEALAEDIAFLQDVRRQLGEVERDLTIALGQKMGKGTGSLADGRMFTVARSSDRKEWDHEDWKRDVRRKVVEVHSSLLPETLIHPETGEELNIRPILHQVITDAQDVHGSTDPRSRALRALGLYASDYCTSKPSGWRFTAVAPHDTTTEKKDA